MLDQTQANNDSRLLARIDERTINIANTVKELRDVVDGIVEAQHTVNEEYDKRIREVEMNKDWDKRLRAVEQSQVRLAAISTVGAGAIVTVLEFLKGYLKIP